MIIKKSDLLTMIKNELFSIISEAAKEDVKKGAEAKAIIDYIDRLIDNYKENNQAIRVFGTDDVQIKYKDLNVLLTSKKPKFKDNDDSPEAQYLPNKKLLVIYGSKIIRKNGGLEVKYNNKDMYHELIHYMDFSRSYKGDVQKYTKALNKRNIKYKVKDTTSGEEKEVTKYDTGKYYKDPLEINAHFFEFVLPNVLKIIQNNENITSKSVSDFVKEIMKDQKFNDFYNHLNDKFKKKIIKRIGVLYQEVKNNKSELDDIASFNVNNLEVEKKKYPWFKKMWDKFGDY